MLLVLLVYIVHMHVYMYIIITQMITLCTVITLCTRECSCALPGTAKVNTKEKFIRNLPIPNIVISLMVSVDVKHHI